MLDVLKAKLAGKKKGRGKAASRSIGAPGSAAQFFYTALIPVLLAVLVAGGGSVYLLGEQQQEAQVQRLEAVSKQLAERVAGSVSQLQVMLGGFVASRPLAELFLAEDDAGLARQEKLLLRLLPTLSAVRLLPAGWNETDSSGQSPFSFASLEMLRSVERSGRASLAEVHQFKRPQQHVAMAVPIKASENEPVVGVLHVTLSFDWLQQFFVGLGQPGRFEIQQSDGGRAVALLSTGQASSSMLVAAPVAGTIWQVASGQVEVHAAGQGLLFGVFALAGGVVFLVLVVQAWRFKRALRKDVATLFGQIERLKEGRPPAAGRSQIGELQPVMEVLRKLPLAAKDQAAGGAVTVAQEVETLMPAVGLMDDHAFSVEPVAAAKVPAISDTIFRAYDIRGIVGDTLTEQVVFDLGRAVGSEAYDQGQQTVIVARDGRNSSAALSAALCKGLMASGRDVVDIGMVPTPVLYFATHFLAANTGVMITGSHNPPEYNGLKIVIGGKALTGQAIAALKDRIGRGNLLQGSGTQQQQDLLTDYIERIIGDVQLSRPLKVVVDCGSGVAGVVAPALLQALGCEVVPLHCQVDGDFPAHHPDPSKPENLQDLIAAVRAKQADIGVAFDGDGDRLGVVDAGGKIIWPDRLLMLLARDVLARQPGADVIYDVKSTRNLASVILASGGRPIMWKTGHSLIKAKMKETGALLAGEMSGHIYFKERWYGFDDGLYSCARLLEILSMAGGDSQQVFSALPESLATPELTLTMRREGDNFALMEKLSAQADFAGAKVVDIDGLRVEFEQGWGLVRASNTTPALVFRFEADDAAALKRIQNLFRQQLLAVDPTLDRLPF